MSPAPPPRTRLSTLEQDLIWKRGLCQCNQVKRGPARQGAASGKQTLGDLPGRPICLSKGFGPSPGKAQMALPGAAEWGDTSPSLSAHRPLPPAPAETGQSLSANGTRVGCTFGRAGGSGLQEVEVAAMPSGAHSPWGTVTMLPACPGRWRHVTLDGRGSGKARWARRPGTIKSHGAETRTGKPRDADAGGRETQGCARRLPPLRSGPARRPLRPHPESPAPAPAPRTLFPTGDTGAAVEPAAEL